MTLDPKTKKLILDTNLRYYGSQKKVAKLVGPGEVKALKKPALSSHKGQNGILLIIAGSKQYHGAPLLAVTIASKIVDLVYFSSVPENNQLIQKMKAKLCEFITIPFVSEDAYLRLLIPHVKKSDAILIGPGLEINKEIKILINNLLQKYPKKKFILDAAAFRMIPPKNLNKNCIITPHKGEFKYFFKNKATEANVKKMAKKYKGIIVLKGKKDLIASPTNLKYNTTGNQGMTKGGTGDVLAGFIAALACKNDLFLSACAGAFLNGLAGDRLKDKVSYYYSASDLIGEIPRVMKWCEDF